MSALFAIGANDTASINRVFIYLAYFPAVMFWVLDAYFLWQERLFRTLYKKVSETKEENIDFSMNVSLVEKETSGIISSLFSLTVLGFHGAIIFSIILVMALL